MTVKELKRILSRCDDNLEVNIEYSDVDYGDQHESPALIFSILSEYKKEILCISTLGKTRSRWYGRVVDCIENRDIKWEDDA